MILCDSDINSPKISVIIPIYNVERYLRKCIDSILAQTYRKLEIILVDDGSPDMCPQICDEYKARDERIRVIHKENGGLSSARNSGLDICTGDYIGFVDSDDWVASTMYEDLLNSISKYKSDIAFCGISRVDETENYCIETLKYGHERVMSNMDFVSDIFLKNHENVCVWNKLYSANVFRNIRFPVGQIYEDAAILPQIVGNVTSLSYADVIGYYYRYRKGSLMNSGKAEKHKEAILYNTKSIEHFMREKAPQLQKEFDCYEVNELAFILDFYNRSGIKKNPEYKSLKKRLWKKIHLYLFSFRTRFKNRISIFLIALGLFEPVQNFWRTINSYLTGALKVN